MFRSDFDPLALLDPALPLVSRLSITYIAYKLYYYSRHRRLRGSHHSPLALEWALDWRAPHLARPMSDEAAQIFVTQVRTSTVLQKSLAGVPIKG